MTDVLNKQLRIQMIFNEDRYVFQYYKKLIPQNRCCVQAKENVPRNRYGAILLKCVCVKIVQFPCFRINLWMLFHFILFNLCK